MGASLRIARHEAARYVGIIDRDMVWLAVVFGLILVASWPLVEQASVDPSRSIYVAESEPGSPFVAIAQSDSQFTVVSGDGALFAAGGADLLLGTDAVGFRPGDSHSESAARAFELAARRWLDESLSTEQDLDAAFPVRVAVAYQTRALVSPATEAGAGGPDNGPDGTNGTFTQPQLAQAAALDQPATVLPNQVDPPFPMDSLILTFAYLVPFNFLAQLQSGSLFAERVRRRGVLVLSSPVTGAQFLLGKTLPYMVASVALAVLVTVVIGSDAWGFAAAMPIMLFGLTSTTLVTLLAPSPRAVTFYLVALTVMLSTFLFLPAIFIDVHPIAFLSPVAVISATIRGEPFTLAEFLYATTPLTLAALVLGAIAVPMMREERLFPPRPAVDRLADSLGDLVSRPAALLAAGALCVPFALALELFVLTFAITLEVGAAFAVFLLGAAAVEEALKGVTAYAHRARTRMPRPPWVTGALVGTGFFLGEKLALLLSIIGFGLLDFGDETLATFGIGPGVVVIVAPLALHIATATITAHRAGRPAGGAWVGWLLATLVHTAYNLTTIVVLLGGSP